MSKSMPENIQMRDIEVTAEAGEIIKPFPEPLEPPEPAELPSSSFSSGQTVAHGQKRSDDADHGDSPKRVKFADAGFSALERTFLLDDTATGESAPKTPKLDEDAKQKSLVQVTSTDLSLYEHEDDSVSFAFNNDELDELEEYELNFCNGELYDSQELSNDEMAKQLMFPFSKEEPNLSAEELQRLDAIADMIEVKRLKSMQVLTDTSEMPADHKVLSTRFVRTGREKLSDTGQPIWLRRSRLVARESAWMDSENDSLFSPASNAIVARLLPTMFLEMKENSDCVMVSIDVKDAFLTAKQQTATVVNCVLADGEVQPYGLGRVLPGQRDGSLLWHRDITSVLHEKLGMTAHVPCPCTPQVCRRQLLCPHTRG